MRVLAIETSERVGSLAALRAEQGRATIVCSKSLPDDQRTAQSLAPGVRDVLKEYGWQPDDLDLICVTTGPGSFTGLRLSVVTAKTLAYATGAELVGVSTLAAIASGAPSGHKRLWAILDAQRQELFASCFADGWQNDPEQVPEIKVVGVDDWLEQLRVGDAVVGPPLKKLRDRLPSGVGVVASDLWAPRAAIVGQLGIVAYQRGQAVGAMQLVPQYYRKSAAEEKAEARD